MGLKQGEKTHLESRLTGPRIGMGESFQYVFLLKRGAARAEEQRGGRPLLRGRKSNRGHSGFERRAEVRRTKTPSRVRVSSPGQKNRKREGN